MFADYKCVHDHMVKSCSQSLTHWSTLGTIFAMVAVLFVSVLVQICAKVLLDLLSLCVVKCMEKALL